MSSLKWDFLLLFVTVLWGFAFVAQQLGMDHLGPFGFNGCRFLLGALLVWLFARYAPRSLVVSLTPPVYGAWKGGIIVGLFLFLGATFQQIGLAGTTAGKAGFLTVLYAVLVPLISHFSGTNVRRSEIVGSSIAFIGSYYLSTDGPFEFERGDILIMIGSLCWAFHALAISRAVQRQNPLIVAWQQFLVCGALSLLIALALESISLRQMYAARYALLFAGGASIALGYTLQVVVQRYVSPTHAVIIFSLEGVFAAVGGVLLLGETMTGRAVAGAIIMLAGVLIAQLWRIRQSPTP